MDWKFNRRRNLSGSATDMMMTSTVRMTRSVHSFACLPNKGVLPSRSIFRENHALIRAPQVLVIGDADADDDYQTDQELMPIRREPDETRFFCSMTIIATPRRVPRMEPEPPVILAPPSTTAAMTPSSSPTM